MSPFKSLFGLEAKEIHQNVILLPLINKEIKSAFNLQESHSGILFTAFQLPYATAIRTNVGASFVGDAVLYLKETPAKRVILFGACGSLADEATYPLGALVCPSKCFELESFSRCLSFDSKNVSSSYPDKDLSASFLKAAGKNMPAPNCVTFGSLALEDSLQNELRSLGAEIIDMECSAFFHAAQDSPLAALALFYISDIIQTKPFFSRQSQADIERIGSSIRAAGDMIKNFLHF